MTSTFPDHAAWSRAVARSHAFMASLHLETGRFDLWAQELYKLGERVKRDRETRWGV